MNKILKPVVQSVSLVALLFVADAQAILLFHPVATVAVVSSASSSANASAAAAANANAAAANANAAAKASAPAAAPAGPPPVGTVVTTLPPGCTTSVLNNVEYQRCGSTYFKPTMMGSNLVFVVAQP
jgi:hypothetical protein